MQCFQNELTYFATAVSYAHKMLMKLAPVACTIKVLQLKIIIVRYLNPSPIALYACTHVVFSKCSNLFATAISYAHKTLMKLAPVDCTIKVL